MVTLGYANQYDEILKIDYECGGFLITTQHVLTAAACVADFNMAPIEVIFKKIETYLGDISINTIIFLGEIKY